MFGVMKRIVANERYDGLIADDIFRRAQVIANRKEGDTHILTLYDAETDKFFYEYMDKNGNWLGERDA